MIIGSLTTGSGQYPTWYLKVKKRRKKDKHTLADLAEATGVSTGSIVRGLQGLIKPDGKIKVGRLPEVYYSEVDLQWLEDEVEAGRVFPVRMDESDISKDQKAIREHVDVLREFCSKAEKIEFDESIEDREQLMKAVRKLLTMTRKVSIQFDGIREMAALQDIGTVAHAGLLIARLAEIQGTIMQKILIGDKTKNDLNAKPRSAEPS